MSLVWRVITFLLDRLLGPSESMDYRGGITS